ADPLEEAELALIAGDDQLTEALVRHAALFAVPVEHAPPGNAAPRLEAVPGIINPGMDDLAVARRGLEADAVLALEHHDFAPGQRQSPCHREPDDTGPHHHAFHRLGHISAALAVLPPLPLAGEGFALPQSPAY